MLKEIIALCLIIVLTAAAFINIAYMDNLSLEIIKRIDEAEQLAIAGQFEDAAEIINSAIKLWDKNRGYTGVFLRHPEIDSSYDCFYDVMAEIYQGKNDALPALCEKLRYHIRCMAEMERISFSSIL